MKAANAMSSQGKPEEKRHNRRESKKGKEEEIEGSKRERRRVLRKESSAIKASRIDNTLACNCKVFEMDIRDVKTSFLCNTAVSSTRPNSYCSKVIETPHRSTIVDAGMLSKALSALSINAKRYVEPYYTNLSMASSPQTLPHPKSMPARPLSLGQRPNSSRW